MRRRIGVLSLGTLLGLAGCIAPRSFKEVQSPQPGRPLGGRPGQAWACRAARCSCTKGQTRWL